MKVLFVTTYVPSLIFASHIYNLTLGLSSEHQIKIVAFEPPETKLDDAADSLGPAVNLIRVPLIKKSLWRRVLGSIVTLEPVTVQTFRNQLMWDTLLSLVKESTFELVVLESLATAQYHPIMNDLATILFTVDSYSRLREQRYNSATSLFGKISSFWDYLTLRRYEANIYKRFDKVLFVSPIDAQYALNCGQAVARQLAVLPNAVDAEYFTPAKVNRDFSLVFVGNMSWQINEHAILWFVEHVWKTMKRWRPELSLYIVGTSPTGAIRQLGESDATIVVTGYVNDIRPFLAKGAVFISPLQIGTGVKNRVLQAMAMAKPIVASPLSVEGIDVADGVHFLLARTPFEYIEHIESLLRSPAKQETLGAAARALVEQKYSLQKVAEQFNTIAKDVIERKYRKGEPNVATTPKGHEH